MEIRSTSNYYSGRKITSRTDLNPVAFKSKIIDEGGFAYMERYIKKLPKPRKKAGEPYASFKKQIFGESCESKTIRQAFNKFSEEFSKLWETYTKDTGGNPILERGSKGHMKVKLEAPDGSIVSKWIWEYSVEIPYSKLIKLGTGKPNILPLLTAVRDIARRDKTTSELAEIYSALVNNYK